ncbi:MAG TPA: glycine betaine ABC transporter substrate-binding protein [Steroidobacteraceae bacterium]|nr:glycine betaine ABC transporter substrate-binding protein [Steroidobacteraceae bacterium]
MAQWLRALTLAMGLCAGTHVAATTAASRPIVVSSKLSSESVMIGQMIRRLLEAHGIATLDRTALGGTPLVRRALLAGEIDLYVEYTGNAGFFFNRPGDAAWKDWRRGYELGARLDREQHGIVWLTPAPASNAWALAVRRDVARRHRLATLSDFARWVREGGRAVLACSAEFANAGTLRSLERTYDFHLEPRQKIVLAGGETAATIAAAAARTNDVNTAMVYGTDGGIAAADLVLLEDDRHDQPVYAPVPTARQAVVSAYPQLPAIVRPLMQRLDAATLQALNARVQIDGESPEAVAVDFLQGAGLLAAGSGR